MNRRQFLAAAVVAATADARVVQERTTDQLPDGVEPVPDGYDRAGWVASKAAQHASDGHLALTFDGHEGCLDEAAEHLRQALYILETEFDV